MAVNPVRRPKIMVSSTVYGIESLLDQIRGLLESWGYEVWMSHAGTIPTDPRLSNAENCLRAVTACDLFLGIITGRHGSGIFAQEVEEAVQKNVLRWFLVHHDVVVARQLLRQFRFDAAGQPVALRLARTPVLESVEVLHTYESAMQVHLPFGRRTGNWVQTYFHPQEALTFVQTQFQDVARFADMLADDQPEGTKQ